MTQLRAFVCCAIAIMLSTLLQAGSARPAAQTADLVIVNAKIYTVNAKQPWAEAAAIRGERIVFVAGRAQAKKFTDQRTKVIDAQGRLVLPGFTDSHIHFMDGSLSLTRVNLEETKNVEEIQNVVRQYVAAHPVTNERDAWVLGRGWSYPEFPGALPHRKYLDAIVPDRPVFLEGFDGHT